MKTVNRDRLISSFLKYLTIDSETGSEAVFAKFLTKELEKMGLSVVRDKIGNVISTFDGDPKIEPLLLCAHMDTVTPGKGIQPQVKDDIITSASDTILGSDDKAGIAIIIETILSIIDSRISHGSLEILFTAGEEGGLVGSKNLNYELIKSKKALILDSSGSVGNIIVKAPAKNSLTVKIIGKPSHAGNKPEEGVSAIQAAAKAIDRMSLLRIDKETTANIGTIKGGRATNIVCPEIVITAETRSHNNNKLDTQTNHMIDCFREAAQKLGAETIIDVKNEYAAYEIDEGDGFTNFIIRAGKRLNIDMKTKASGGGSDANNLNANGIKALNLAVGMTNVHTLEEKIAVNDLVNGASLVFEVIQKAGSEKKYLSDQN
jgi:tripeptide aminopeptidase